MKNCVEVHASHSIGVEVQKSFFRDDTTLEFLIKKGEKLPVEGKKEFLAVNNVKAGSNQALIFKLWEGENTDNVADNRFIRCLKITGDSFEYDSIKRYSQLTLVYKITEAGTIVVNVEIPYFDDEAVFESSKEFFRLDNKPLDLNDNDTIFLIADEGESILREVEEMADIVNDGRLAKVRRFAQDAIDLKEVLSIDSEVIKNNDDNLIEAKIILDQVRKDNLQSLRINDLEKAKQGFAEIESMADNTAKQEIQDLLKLAETVIDNDDKTFETTIDRIIGLYKIIGVCGSKRILISWFQEYRQKRYLFSDKKLANELIRQGENALENEDFIGLNWIVRWLYSNDRRNIIFNNEGISEIANIMLRGK